MISTYLESLFSILLFLILIFWLYRDYCLDKFRQDLFSLRDSFFDEASQRNIPFDSSAYGMMRSTMNGAIRFAHRFNFLQLVFLQFIVECNGVAPGSTFSERLEKNMEGMSDEQKELVVKYRKQMNYLMLEFLVFSSPILLISLFIPAAFLLEAKEQIEKLMKVFKTPLERIDSVALATGEM